jgi:hypothetical protein
MQSHHLVAAALVAAIFAAAVPDTAHAVRGSGGLTFPSQGKNGGFGVCKKKYLTATGKAWDKGKAKKRARRNWSTKVTFTYGHPYNDWDSASQRQYGCNKNGRWWHCSAFAYPCL